mgnify:CR=1 FL=1
MGCGSICKTMGFSKMAYSCRQLVNFYITFFDHLYCHRNRYHQGRIPPKRHTVYKKSDGYNEKPFSAVTNSFDNLRVPLNKSQRAAKQHQHLDHKLQNKIKSVGDAQKYYEKCLSLPLFPSMDEEDVVNVVNKLTKIISTSSK